MSNRPRILVVDDNETNRDILKTRLEASGYAVLQAGDGEQALEVARLRRPDAILLDIMMPKLDGLEVCRRIKADLDLPFTPIILVTAKSDTHDVVAGLEAGADEYLTKPIDQKALVARIAAMLRLKALQENASRPSARKPTDAEVFISYSHQDRDRIEPLAAALERSGWSVWWDRHLKSGQSFDREIERAIEQANAVLVAWSKYSVESDWVRAEAAFAQESGKLLPIRFDDAKLPLRFIHVYTINLSHWDGTPDQQVYGQVLADLTDLVARRDMRTS